MRRTSLLAVTVWLQLFAQTAPDIPENLKPPAGEKLAMKAHASGSQIYTCDGSQWTLTAPDANLFDDAGRRVGRHFAGPTWQSSDGSRVVGKAVANATVDAHSIPWLLVSAIDHSGQGAMAGVSSIQRVHTHGGKAPATGCDAGHKGEETRVAYTADYYFYSKK